MRMKQSRFAIRLLIIVAIGLAIIGGGTYYLLKPNKETNQTEQAYRETLKTFEKAEMKLFGILILLEIPL